MVAHAHASSHSSPEPENKVESARNARLGMVLFSAYLLLYGAFVGLNAFASGVMDRIVWQGVNLAVLYGFGLIVAAIVLAMVYGWLCRSRAVEPGENALPPGGGPS
jgi:uncharacterized membrane protein (DUF485 family)